ncbi:hypothetical protein D1Q00_gp170 [Trichoplusia ni granulovirus LBIV-12]|uniref:Uncharacterized protein n=2 Tax=Betabaculovirus TaxID=558017 RepID=A0A1D8QLJ6_GVTN|nr:hypothetical protein PsunGV_gp181 [Pseudalatia unipuncta granulovirus]YP_009506240.1 hypothetical protein D1Q00_gp170 [Trichoplusia ni granulovirus LBIV-12]ACH69531.1 unknown [Pseudalatia unipuncta granulovirus]AOW41508.1 hypothetical protein [Trichoplusia ni granulovirus LBIV-12]
MIIAARLKMTSTVLRQPNKLIKISFNKCLEKNLQVKEYMPPGVVYDLLHDYLVNNVWTSEQFKRVLLNYAYTNNTFGDVLKLLLTTNVCKFVNEMVDDEERVDDILNWCGKWTWEDVFDFVVYVQMRMFTNTEYIFYEHVRATIVADQSLCRFCVNKPFVREVCYFTVDEQCELSDLLLDMRNYCIKCHGPLFVLSEFYCDEMTLCCEEM